MAKTVKYIGKKWFVFYHKFVNCREKTAILLHIDNFCQLLIPVETPDFLHKISNSYHEHEIINRHVSFLPIKGSFKSFHRISNKVQITCLEKYMFDSSLDSFFFFRSYIRIPDQIVL